MPDTPQPILGTNIASAVVPFTTADQFPTHHALYGKGGWRSVLTTVDRDAIPTPRLEDGMVVYVTDIQTAYVYLDGLWQELTFGGGGAKQTFTRLTYTNSIEDLPPETLSSFELPFGKTSMILQLTVSRPVKVTVYSTPDYTDTNPYTFLATSDHLTDDGSALLSDGTILKQRNYSIFANLESPPQERVYAVVESVDSGTGPVTIDITYIIIESGIAQPGGSSGINVLLNNQLFDEATNTLDFSGDNWTLQNQTNGLPSGTVRIETASGISNTNYVVPMNFTYSPDPNEILLIHTFVESVRFDPNFFQSAGFVEGPPDQPFVMNVYKNGSMIGSITVSTDGFFTFDSIGTVFFNTGNTLKITAPSLSDDIINNLSLSLLGIRVPTIP